MTPAARLKITTLFVQVQEIRLIPDVTHHKVKKTIRLLNEFDFYTSLFQEFHKPEFIRKNEETTGAA